MEEKPNYYAVIPASIRYDNELRANEKLLYGEITALAQKTGECWASNKYFCELYEVQPNAVATWLRHLKEKEYIEIEYIYKGKEIEKRVIKIGGIQKDMTYSQKDMRVFTKRYGGTIQKGEENNTSINNTRIIIQDIKENKKKIPYEEIIEYLNEKAGTKYRPQVKETQRHIKARYDEGFTLEDFKKVIDNKVQEWKGTQMNKYLRPSTLFATKFENYLNQERKKTLAEMFDD